MRLTIFILAAAPAWACTMVEGDRILGSHMAAEATAFAKLDPNDDLGPAPHAGSRRVYRGFELERLAQKYETEMPTGEVCFERATQPLSPEVLLPILQTAMESGEVELVDYSRNALPLGSIEFPRSGLEKSGLWRGRLVYGENRSIPIWARVWTPESAPPERVERGEVVRVEIARGAVMLSFESPAESSGEVGETILVRNPANGQRFRAVVEAKGKVSIHP